MITRTNEELVFGLDIGTRNIVGTVGYKTQNRFVVVGQTCIEHETRAMIDGQIHDIHQVGERIKEVVAILEKKTGEPLKQVCIAAAGRVLRTVTIHADVSYPEDKLITREDILALDSHAIEKAYDKFQVENKTDIKFYCVGYSVMKYYMNNYLIGNLEDHKAKDIGVDLIATFLPDDVVDGLYRAVEYAGLEVANLTLEPIAAIEVAIPEMYRMLNIGLIDVGAGTSDISITKDGSIVAYGMLSIAGDSLTEVIARHCLVDFVTAEHIKRGVSASDSVEYKDIMGLTQTISKEEVTNILRPSLEDMAKQAAEKILELNGGKPVSAIFVVGGGGKFEGYTDIVAENMGIPKERCAVRGAEVMDKIDFLEADVTKDSLLITPIGICLNYYEKSNNFIFVTFNDKRVKMYDNNRLSIIDVAIQANFPNDRLFSKRGKSLTFTVDGKQRVIRGEPGEPSVITLNGETADIHTLIRKNDVIVVKESTIGEPGHIEIGKLFDSQPSIGIYVNNKMVHFPKFASVNGQLQSSFYEIAENDSVKMLNYYTVKQIVEFMDVILDNDMYIYVNNAVADLDTKVYDNFSVVWTLKKIDLPKIQAIEKEKVSFSGKYTSDEISYDDLEDEDSYSYDEGDENSYTYEEDGNSYTYDEEDGNSYTGNENNKDTNVRNADDKDSHVRDADDKDSHVRDADDKDSYVRDTDDKDFHVRDADDKDSYVRNTDDKNANDKNTDDRNADDRNADDEDSGASNADDGNSDADNVNDKGASTTTQNEGNAANSDQTNVIHVVVNKSPLTLTGKKEYIFVDVFDLIDFDLSKPMGISVETLLNGQKATYVDLLSEGDELEIFWKTKEDDE